MAAPRTGNSRVDRVAAELGVPSEDLRNAMRKEAGDTRVATLSVRLTQKRSFTYARETSMDRVARELGVSAATLRAKMRYVALCEGKQEGVWTISVRVW